MKKHLLYLITCAIFLALRASSFATPFVQPVRTLEIPFVGDSYDDEIILDGTVDAAYSPEQTTEAFNMTGSTGADDDFTFTFRVTFDVLYLYLYCEIHDDFDNSVSYTTTPYAGEYDNVEIFISLDTTGTTAAYDTNTIQLRINRGIDSIQLPGRSTTDRYIHHWENTATGWLFETAIPWKAVLADSQEPYDVLNYLTTVNGFEVHGNDSDELGPGHLDCQTAWDMDDPDDEADRTEAGAGSDRTLFGVFTFELCDDCSAPPWNKVELASGNRISLYPNPSGNLIHFSVDDLSTVAVYTLTGIKVIETKTTGEMDISNLKSGMYLAEINGDSFVKFIKE